MNAPVLLEVSFADAIVAIERSDLPVERKRHWTCSLRQIARALDRPLETIPARWSAVRGPVSRLHYALTGNREKTLQNHKANVRRALLWLAGEHNVPARGMPLSGAWAGLRERIADKGVRARLSGLMRYCSAMGIAPEGVDEAVIDAFMTYRAATTNLDTKPAARRSIARAWNGCAGVIQGWPGRRLHEPPVRTAAMGPRWEELPEGLRTDIEAYLATFTRVRRDLRGRRRRPCRASSIATRRAELMAVIATAVKIVPLSSLMSLRALVEPNLVEQVLEAYWARNGERPGTFTIDLAWKLQAIGRHVGLDEAALARLDDLRAELETHRRQGMTPKNLALIRQVLTDGVWSRVVNLPDVLMQEARRQADHAGVKAAVTAQLAVAVAILTVAPVRLGNLGRIRLDDNLTRPGGLGTPYWLMFPDYDVKNDVTLTFKLDQRLTDLIDEYVHDFRPALLRGSNEPWLFPGETGGHKGLATLSAQVTERIRKATGLRITVHQFRHAAAAVFLREEPGNYETVRRLLGHRNIQTTIRFYCALGTIEATDRFGDIIRGQLSSRSTDDDAAGGRHV